jgi:hypothetical protein
MVSPEAQGWSQPAALPIGSFAGAAYQGAGQEVHADVDAGVAQLRCGAVVAAHVGLGVAHQRVQGEALAVIPPPRLCARDTASFCAPVRDSMIATAYTRPR